MNLENMMLSEWSQTQGVTYCMIPFLCHVQNWKFHRDRKQISEGMEEEGLLQNYVGILLEVMKMF